MIATITKVEVQNLIYVAGALVLIVILSVFVTLRHRRPKSVESNMASFNKGLQALAPDAEPARRRLRPSPVRPTPPTPAPRRTVTIRPSVSPAPAGGTGSEADALGDGRVLEDETAGTIAADTPTTLEAETG
jgi:hypothetical protein